jgi:hypothetical protein
VKGLRATTKAHLIAVDFAQLWRCADLHSKIWRGVDVHIDAPPYIDRYIQDAASAAITQIQGPYLSIDRPLPATGCKQAFLADLEVTG